jgi:hypothetical protein
MNWLCSSINSILQSVPASPPADIAPEVGGFTSSTIRWFLNQLGGVVAGTRTAYLEVGCFKGATLRSAMEGNDIPEVVAFDDFSETFGETPEEIREQLLRNLLPCVGEKFTLYEKDFLEADFSTEHPVGVCFYDGCHSVEAQSKALCRVWVHAARDFVYVVDDWDWEDVRAGTYRALASLRPEFYTMWERTDQIRRSLEQPGPRWHNGLGIFVIDKGM